MSRNHSQVIASSGIAALLCCASVASAQTAPPLGTAQSYAVLAGSTVTNTGSSVIAGDLGVSPGTAVVGFPPGVVVFGTIHAGDASAAAAQSSLTAAYIDVESQACTQDLTGQDLGGLTLTSGVYCFSTSAQLTGTLTLDAQGNTAAVFIFKMGSTLTTASASSVVLINGGAACRVFWQVGSSATLGTTTTFAGNIMALASITVTTGSNVTGRLLARTGAVTLDNNAVNATCAGAPGCPTITLSPATLPTGTVGVAYNQTIVASGGTAPYVFALIAGVLPPGMTLTPDGVLSGTPTAASTSVITIRATDANGCFASVDYTMSVIVPVPTLPQIFVVILALGLGAAGYLRLRRRATPTLSW